MHLDSLNGNHTRLTSTTSGGSGMLEEENGVPGVSYSGTYLISIS